MEMQKSSRVLTDSVERKPSRIITIHLINIILSSLILQDYKFGQVGHEIIINICFVLSCFSRIFLGKVEMETKCFDEFVEKLGVLDAEQKGAVIKAIMDSSTTAEALTMKNLVERRIKKRKLSSLSSSSPKVQRIHQSPKLKSLSSCHFIFREDLIPVRGNVYMDVEKVTLKLNQTLLEKENIVYTGNKDSLIEGSRRNRMRDNNKHFAVAGSIVIVNEQRDIILYAIVKWPSVDVCQYMESISGLSREVIHDGVELCWVQKCMRKVLKDNNLVGVNLLNDLKSLLYVHDLELCEDLQLFYKDKQGQPFSLKSLVNHYFPNVMNFQSGKHSALVDARMTQRLHVKKLELMKESNGTVRNFDIVRVSSRAIISDRCRCKK